MRIRHIVTSAIVLLIATHTPAYAHQENIYGLNQAMYLPGHAKGIYYLSLNAFKQEQNASRFYHSIQKKGIHNASMKHRNGFYIVGVGPLYSAREVHNIAKKLEAADHWSANRSRPMISSLSAESTPHIAGSRIDRQQTPPVDNYQPVQLEKHNLAREASSVSDSLPSNPTHPMKRNWVNSMCYFISSAVYKG